jgi:hypothetical protein
MKRAFVLAFGLVVLLICNGQATAQEWRTFSNTDLPGSDYRNFEIVPRVDSIAGDGVASRCEEACKGDPTCKAWTAVRPGIQSKNGKCWLKTSIPARKANKCCTSGGNAVWSRPRPDTPGQGPAPSGPRGRG